MRSMLNSEPRLIDLDSGGWAMLRLCRGDDEGGWTTKAMAARMVIPPM